MENKKQIIEIIELFNINYYNLKDNYLCLNDVINQLKK